MSPSFRSLQSSVETTPRNNQTKSPQIDVFTELDPLGTGLIRPYVDKKDFFQNLKNPPKKVLKDLVSTSSSDSFPTNFNITTTSSSLDSTKTQDELSKRESEESNFANFDRFDENEASQSSLSEKRIESPPKKEITATHHQPLSVSLPPEETSLSKGTTVTTSTTTVMSANASAGSSILRSMDKDSTESTHTLVKLPSPKKYLQSVRKRDFDIDLPAGKTQPMDSKPFPVDFSTTTESPASPLKSCSSDANSRLSSSSAELDLAPEPPPRDAGSILINPPPLPPKKQGARGGMRPPPRPPHGGGHFHYDFPEREASPSPTRIAATDRNKSPPKDMKSQFDDNFTPPTQMSSRLDFINTMTTSTFEDSFSSMIPHEAYTSLSSLFTRSSLRLTKATAPAESKKTKPSLDITLSQLTSSNLDELASSLGMTVQELTSLTLQQLTECLASLSTKETTTGDTGEESVMSQSTTTITTGEQDMPVRPVLSTSSTMSSSKPLESTSFISSELFKSSFESESKQDATYDKYAVFRELLEMEQMEQQKEEAMMEETAVKEEKLNEERASDEVEIQPEAQATEDTSDSLASLVNLTVKLPSTSEDLLKEEAVGKLAGETSDSLASSVVEKEMTMEIDDRDVEKENEATADADMTSDSSTFQQTEIDVEDDTEKTHTITEVEEKTENSERGSDANGTSDKLGSDILNEETNGSVAERSSEVKSSTSTSSDRYAALREIIGEPEPPLKKDDDEMMSSARASPVILPQSVQPKSLAEVELLNLFSDNLPPPSSPSISAKKDNDLKAVAMDIFEEIKMLNTGTHRAKDTKPPMTSGFEDVFCPFTETSSKLDKDDGKEDGNWAKFDTSIFGSDRSSCEGQRSIGGTSPWSPDGKDFHREVPFKGSSGYRHSGDSDNEWKDEEESEESNGRVRGDARFWSGSRHARFDAPGFEERPSFYEEGDKRDRSFREKMGRKSRAAPWTKNTAHRPRDPSPWHEEGQWEEESRRYPHRIVPYKDDEDQYEAHWKCRPKPQGRCNWTHDVHVAYYDDERKRKLMLWNEELECFGSQESMGYDEEDRWSRRRYDRRRWEEDPRFWARRGPSEADYPMRDPYYYYRDRPHDYPSTWDEEYGPERPGDDSLRYNPICRKRHWPKRPNSANEGRNSDMVYADPRKFGASRLVLIPEYPVILEICVVLDYRPFHDKK